jgi:hypothetical protein
MSSNINDQRNWLERLGDKIPGYNGYVDKERRRDVDKLHREHLADRLRAIKAPLTDVIRDLTSVGRLFEVTPVESALKKLDHLENRVRFASYGYSGFFDAVKIEQQQLDSIYQFDLSLIERVEQLESKGRALKSQATTAEGLKAGAADLNGAIDEIGRYFDQRYEAINNFGQGNPPGRPLFQG